MTLDQRTYVMCLDCGEDIAYDWELMAAERAKYHALSRLLSAVGLLLVLLVVAVLVEMPQ